MRVTYKIETYWRMSFLDKCVLAKALRMKVIRFTIRIHKLAHISYLRMYPRDATAISAAKADVRSSGKVMSATLAMAIEKVLQGRG